MIWPKVGSSFFKIPRRVVSSSYERIETKFHGYISIITTELRHLLMKNIPRIFRNDQLNKNNLIFARESFGKISRRKQKEGKKKKRKEEEIKKSKNERKFSTIIILTIKLRRCSTRDVNVIYKVRGQPRRITIFTINSRYTINTRTWINRSVFALDIPLWPRGHGDRSRINSRGIVRLYYVDEAALSKYPIPR